MEVRQYVKVLETKALDPRKLNSSEKQKGYARERDFFVIDRMQVSKVQKRIFESYEVLDLVISYYIAYARRDMLPSTILCVPLYNTTCML